ncbi:hypothetical protein [Kribbella sp. C-35]|uniref:hypothetical protein n=1 Tax=Kribbella sp. C-35 TaxID=2789276 RepID=UPI00397934EA
MHSFYSINPWERSLLTQQEREELADPTKPRTERLWEAPVARRIDRLVAEGCVYFRVIAPPAMLGFSTEVAIWLRVASAHLDEAAHQLVEHPGSQVPVDGRPVQPLRRRAPTPPGRALPLQRPPAPPKQTGPAVAPGSLPGPRILDG